MQEVTNSAQEETEMKKKLNVETLHRLDFCVFCLDFRFLYPVMFLIPAHVHLFEAKNENWDTPNNTSASFATGRRVAPKVKKINK